jgi:NADH-quinone oxidoreductase subunit M
MHALCQKTLMHHWYAATGALDFPRLAAGGALAGRLGGPWATVVFLGLFLGLAVKVPLFPFHTWRPPAWACW